MLNVNGDALATNEFADFKPDIAPCALTLCACVRRVRRRRLTLPYPAIDVGNRRATTSRTIRRSPTVTT